jgi:hypothetical protein
MMYRYSVHNLIADSGDIQSPGADWFLRACFKIDATTAMPMIVRIWEKNYASEDEWGGYVPANAYQTATA